MVREHAQKGGFQANSVSEVRSIIDPTTGYLATEWCPVTRNEYYKPELPLPTFTPREITFSCKKSS